MKRTAYLVLENGKTFKGSYFGAQNEITAEIVFFTGMVGYLSVLTDKSYKDKMVVATFPVAGNYGIIPSNFESDIAAPAAYIVKSWCQLPSNFRSEGDIDAFFVSKGITGLCDIDTRTLTEILRENGKMNAVITANPESVDLAALKNYKERIDISEITVKETEYFGEPDAKTLICVPDYGCKKSVIEKLTERGCRVALMPFANTAEEICALNPDGILLPGGPGDPNLCTAQIETVKELCKKNIPILGIGLGHQILALANGYEVTPGGHGHHGSNQPVKNIQTGAISITSQSHSYAVCWQDGICNAKQTFANVNDGTNEGISYNSIPAFSVQFYPENGGGANDTLGIYDSFISMTKEED